MSVCPVCDQRVPGGDDAVARHVNAHFDEGGNDNINDNEAEGFSITGGTNIPAPPTETCFVCGTSLEGLDAPAANAHVNSCLDGGAGGAPAPEIRPEDYEDYQDDEDFYLSDREHGSNGRSLNANRSGRKVADVEWDGTVFADKSGSSDKVAKGDKWWDPVRGSLAPGAVPLNISPGLIPILREMLQRSASSGSTRSAVLARGGVHIKGSFGFDSTWGCGYRNALMAIANMQTQNLYPTVFSHRADPGVRSLQQWIEEAWRSGFDPTGREQLKGKLSGSQKWIGTADLYAMFTSMGIPCVLYDFNKPSERGTDEPTHKILQRWVRDYFDENEAPQEDTDGNAFTELMAPKVRIGTKNPFILQHAGHSRTVVGYELAGKDINLLMFDPGKSVPKDVREAGVAGLRNERANPSVAGYDITPGPSHETIREGDAAAEPSSDEEVRTGGWVKKRKQAKDKGKDPLLSSLSAFRSNLGRWKHNQFQVLVFPGTPILSAEEKNLRKEVDSVDVQR